jgi:hypothetical protein
LLPNGAAMFLQATRIITPVTWLAAPDWLTVSEAAWLSGHDPETTGWLIQDGDVDTRRAGCQESKGNRPSWGWAPESE